MDKRIYEDEILWFFNADINLLTLTLFHAFCVIFCEFKKKIRNLFSGVVPMVFRIFLFVSDSVNSVEYLCLGLCVLLMNENI